MRMFLFVAMLAIAVASRPIMGAGDAVSSLSQVKLFAFGGIGIAGTPSPGQTLFQQVLAGSEPLEHFRTVLKEGTPEARLYALCGLWVLDRAAFADAAASIKADKRTSVQTAAGCMISHQDVSSIARSIEEGRFDHYLSKKRAE